MEKSWHGWRLNNWVALLCATLWLLASGAGVAQVDVKRAVEAESAMTRLLRAVEDGTRDGNYPRLSDPAVAEIFAQAFDRRIVATAAPSVKDLPKLSSLQNKAGEIARAYIGSGHPGDDLDRAAANFLEFLPEIAVVYDFSLVTGAQIATVTSQVAGQVGALGDEEPSVRPAVTAIAETQAHVLELLVGCSTDPNISVSWRRDRLVLMKKTANRYSRLLPTEIAQSIADRALAAAIFEEDEHLAADLNEFALSILR